MPEKILRVVALPSTMFWAPQMPAMANMGVHAMLMVYGLGLAGISPLVFIASFFLAHLFIAAQGVREPHMTTLIQAWAVSRKSTKNLIKTPKIRKYVP